MGARGKKLDMDNIAKGLGARRIGKIPRPKGGYFGAMKTARDVAKLRQEFKAKTERILVLVTPQAATLKDWTYVVIAATKGDRITADLKATLKDDPHWANCYEFLPSKALSKGKKFPEPGFHVWECIPERHGSNDEWDDDPYWTFDDGHWRKPLAEDKWPAAFRLPRE